MTAEISKVCGDIASDSVSKWSFQGKLAACGAAGCSLGTHQHGKYGHWGGWSRRGYCHPCPPPSPRLCKITSQSQAWHCINLRTSQTAGKPPKENNVRITVPSTGHFLMSAPYFWCSLEVCVCTARSISCPCSSPSPALAPLTPHQVSAGILPPESAHWFLGSCWQEEGAGGRAVCCSHVPVRTPPERALEHAPSTWVCTAPN